MFENGAAIALPPHYNGYSSLNTLLSRLGEIGIIRSSLSIGESRIVTPSIFVGEARAPGFTVRIQPKSVELFEQMRTLASDRRVRSTSNLEASRIILNEHDESHPAHEFLEALKRCMHDGIPWDYAKSKQVTSVPRGKIELNESIRRLECRGIRHRVITTVTKRQQRQSLVRVVRTAAMCARTALDITPKLLTNIQILTESLEPHPPFPSISEATNVALSEIAVFCQPIHSSVEGLLRRSLSLLLQEENQAGTLELHPSYRIHFQNLQDLWEVCVHTLASGAFNESQGLDAKFHPYRLGEYLLLHGGGPMLDPDVVVTSEESPRIIIDAKYKCLETASQASASDIYQLYAYVTRMDAELGMLVYYTNREAFIDIIGTTSSGRPLAVVGISPSLIRAEGRSALEYLLASRGLFRERLD